MEEQRRLDIEGVLVKPVGYQPGKRYPLLVDVHGGPTGAHTNGFKVGVHNGGQLWAGQGWAVLYPNPRGSSNYGEKFMRGNIPDWGGGDYRDIMAGADEVIKRGIADPDKLAVMGWSYGGYMTCWIVSQTTRFKAARMGAGLSNISQHVRDDRHPRLHRHVLRELPDARRTSSCTRSARVSPTSTTSRRRCSSCTA